VGTAGVVRKVAGIPALDTGVLSFIVAELARLELITRSIMSAGLGVATAVYDAIVESRKQQLAIEQNQLYFYYKAGQLLSNGTHQYRRS
jgi:hypothetical protein